MIEMPDLSLERFWAKADTSGDCWPWQGARNPRGYGNFRIGSRKDGSRKWVAAHRWIYEQVVGPIPTGMTIDHTCHNGSGCTMGDDCPHRACVNPAHLEPVSNKENNARGAANITHCPAGHEYTDDNTAYWGKGTARSCRRCNRAEMRKQHA